MQVAVEQLEGLERRLTVQLPADRVDQAIQERLQSLSTSVRLDGFRPGKVPMKLMRRLYGQQVQQEVTEQLVRESFQSALEQENLKPISPPDIDLKPTTEGGLSYSAQFEVAPDIEPIDPAQLVIDKPSAHVVDRDVDAMLENLRQQHAEWQPVERAPQQGDQVTITFKGEIDGAPFAGSEGEGVKAVMGKQQLPPEFEQQLVALQPGASADVEVHFAADYPNTAIANRKAQFSLTLNQVAEPQLPALDDEFVQRFELPTAGLEGLRQELRKNLERELQKAVNNIVKQQLAEKLLLSIDIPLPKSAIANELKTLLAQESNHRHAHGAGSHDHDHDHDHQSETHHHGDEQLAQRLEPEARRRTKLGLILSKMINDYQLAADEQRMQAKLLSLVEDQPPQQAMALMDMLRKNPEMVENLRSAVLEDMLYERLADEASVREKPCSFDDVMKSYRTGAPLPEESTP